MMKLTKFSIHYVHTARHCSWMKTEIPIIFKTISYFQSFQMKSKNFSLNSNFVFCLWKDNVHTTRKEESKWKYNWGRSLNLSILLYCCWVHVCVWVCITYTYLKYDDAKVVRCCYLLFSLLLLFSSLPLFSIFEYIYTVRVCNVPMYCKTENRNKYNIFFRIKRTTVDFYASLNSEPIYYDGWLYTFPNKKKKQTQYSYIYKHWYWYT